MRFTVEEIAALTSGTILREPRRPAALQPVSRYRHLVSDACYFPIRRLRDPADEARFLREKQPAAVVMPRFRQGPDLRDLPDAGIIETVSPWRAYFQVAAAARARSRALIVGITGSAGKTSVTEFLATALSRRYPVLSSQGSRNICLDCCDLLLNMEGTAEEAVVIEMGFDRVGDVDRMARTARPQIGIITNITEAHLAGANDAWAVLIREKGRLGESIPADGCLIISADDPGCQRLPFAKYVCDVRTFGYSPGADVRLTSVDATETGLRLTMNCFGRKLDLSLRVFGEWQAVNVAAVALAAHVAGVPFSEVKEALESKPPPSHRFHIYRFEKGLTVIDDTFNTSVDTVERGLYAAARLAGQRRKVAYLGGVKWLGAHSVALHRRIGQAVARLGYGQVVVFRRHYGEGLLEGLMAGGLRRDQVKTIGTFEEAPDALMPLLGPETVLYCKTENAGPEVDAVLQRLQLAGWPML